MAEIYDGTGLLAARMAGASPELTLAAHQVKTRIKALAPVDSGSYASSIHVEKTAGKDGVQDRVVVSSDPAALAIEFGHKTSKGTFVPGHFPFIRGSRT